LGNIQVSAGKKYYELLSQLNQNRQKQPGNPQQGNDPSQGGTHGDDGSSPEKSKIWDMYDAMKGGETTVCSHEKWKEFMDGLPEADRKLIEKQIDYQVKEIAADIKKKGRGTIPGELQSYIDSLFEITEAVIDWKSYLRRFAGSSDKTYTKKTRRKLNKRYEENPALKIKTKKHILVGIDTSGSVSNNDLLEFFNELHHIYKTGVKISVVEGDTQIHRVYEYNGKAPEFVQGRGGTYMSPIIEYYNKHHKEYNTLIILTDGECESEPVKARTQMLWVICSSGIDIKKIEQFPGAKVKINKQ
jgi:predicted metal-dependent peptidase